MELDLLRGYLGGPDFDMGAQAQQQQPTPGPTPPPPKPPQSAPMQTMKKEEEQCDEESDVEI
eukprot:3560978-Alexandrium_andersonii.AAC.1